MAGFAVGEPPTHLPLEFSSSTHVGEGVCLIALKTQAFNFWKEPPNLIQADATCASKSEIATVLYFEIVSILPSYFGDSLER